MSNYSFFLWPNSIDQDTFFVIFAVRINNKSVAYIFLISRFLQHACNMEAIVVSSDETTGVCVGGVTPPIF